MFTTGHLTRDGNALLARSAHAGRKSPCHVIDGAAHREIGRVLASRKFARKLLDPPADADACARLLDELVRDVAPMIHRPPNRPGQLRLL